MSEFMKTVSSLKQNVFACLPAMAGRQASPVLQKPGGLPSRRVGGDSLVVWLPGDTKRGGGGCSSSPRGVGWVTDTGIFVSENADFRCRRALARH